MKKSNLLASIALFSLIFAGCTAMTTLPNAKLMEVASAVTNKPIVSISSVRSIDDKQFFDAQAKDGTTYACQLNVVFGVTSQHQKCDLKK